MRVKYYKMKKKEKKIFSEKTVSEPVSNRFINRFENKPVYDKNRFTNRFVKPVDHPYLKEHIFPNYQLNFIYYKIISVI